MYGNRSWQALLLLLPLFVAAACGAPDQEEAAMDQAEEAAEMQEPVEEMTPAPLEFSIMLETVNESGVTGTASATPQAGSVVVDVEVTGVSEGEELPAHIHQGTCATGGSVLAPLTSIPIADGSGTSSTTLDPGQIPAGQSAFVQVHAPGGEPVACADLPARDQM